jgi:N,N-dimethylformamidase
MATIAISGYTDKVSVGPGETISIMTSVENSATAEVQIVRLVHGDEHPDGPGFVEELIDASVNGTHSVHKQFVDTGNAVVVTDPQDKLALGGPFTIWSYVFPTTPTKGRQVILGRFSLADTAGYALGLTHEGRLTFWVANGNDTDEIISDVPLIHHTWYFVSVSYDPNSGTAILHQEAIINPYNGRLGRVAPFNHTCTVEQKLRMKPAFPNRLCEATSRISFSTERLIVLESSPRQSRSLISQHYATAPTTQHTPLLIGIPRPATGQMESVTLSLTRASMNSMDMASIDPYEQ